MPTALEYAALFGRRKPTPEEVTELHRLRELDFASLAQKDVITIEEIQALEWGVKFKVANELFDRCEPAAQHALLHDPHHGVRSAASLFKPFETALQPKPASAAAPLAQATVAEVAAAIMNGKQRIATMYGLKTSAGLEEMIASTHPASLLQRAEAFVAGFEGDDLQDESVHQLLADLRSTIKPIS